MIGTAGISVGLLVRLALAVPLLLVLPGGLLLRLLLQNPARSDAGPEPGLAASEAVFIRLILSVAAVSWLAILLAELGRLSFDLLLVVAAVACIVLRLRLGPAGPRPRPPEQHRLATKSVIGLAAVLLLAALVFLPPFQSVIWASDATVYLNFGHRVAETRALLFEDPLLEEISVPARSELFHNPVPDDVTGTYARFPGGFLIPEITATEVTAGFAPLLPVLLALVDALLGLTAALYVAPVLAILAIGTICLVGWRLRGPPAGLLAAVLITLSLPQIWFARLGTSEVVAELFVFAGLLALLIAPDFPRFAAAGGALFGLAIFAKFDLIVVLPVAVAGFIAIALWCESDAQRTRIKHFAIAFSLLLTHAVVHFFIFPTHYQPFIRRKIESLLGLAGLSIAARPALLAFVIVAAIAVLAWIARWSLSREQTASKGAALVLLAMIVAYGAAYMSTSTSHLRETLPWVGWYLSWTVVMFFLLAATLELRRARQHADASSLFTLVLLASAALHYLYDPHEPIVHIWSVRRLVPIVLPAMLLIVSVSVAGLRGRISRRAWRWTAPAMVLLLIGLVARPSLAIVGETPWEGAIDKTAAIADLLPPDAVLLVGSDLSGTHLATSLDYIFGTDAILLRDRYLHPSTVETQIVEWLSAGRSVFLLIGNDTGPLIAPRLSLARIRRLELELSMLETTTSRIPETVLDNRVRLSLYRLAESPRKHIVDVGTVADDYLFGLRGFYAAERSPDPALGSFRWTGAVASIELPAAGDEIRLVLAGGRPDGSEAAEITIRVNQRPVIERFLVPSEPTTITVENRDQGRAGVTNVTIESNVFRPRDLGLSPDERELGVKVYRVEF
jgi:hypothetical protein